MGENGGGYKERGGRIVDETGDGYWFQPEPRHAHDAVAGVAGVAASATCT